MILSSCRLRQVICIIPIFIILTDKGTNPAPDLILSKNENMMRTLVEHILCDIHAYHCVVQFVHFETPPILVFTFNPIADIFANVKWGPISLNWELTK